MQRPTPRKRKPAARKTLPTWALVWIALTLIVLVIFMANKATIDQVIETTGFTQAVQGDQGSPTVINENPIDVHPPRSTQEKQLTDTSQDELIKDLQPVTALPVPLQTTDPRIPASAGDTSVPSVSADQTNQATKPYKTYFVTVNGDGLIDLSPVVKKLPLSSSPLTSVINALLAGPNPEELSRGYLSLIPSGTKLLSIRIQDSTAILSFSDDFQFNTLGMEGYTAQLKQVVFTATEFSTVSQVKILIDGKEREYLGSEAIPIGGPLTRSSLNR